MAKSGSHDATPAHEAPFDAILRRLREAAGLTQEELASRAGLSPRAIRSLERGERKRPYPHTVRALANALELTHGERAALVAAVPERGEAARATTDTSARSPIPVPPTPLVGRERHVEEVMELLLRPKVRLLTLTGTGGVGKTRLALEVVRETAEHFPDGAAFVALAPLTDPTLVMFTVARAMGLREAEGRSPQETLRSHLQDKSLLLVLDNFEHVLDAAPEVASLMETCPEQTILATSRAPLRLRGEYEYAVSPLELPATTLAPSVDEVMGSPSGRLFAERARAAASGFEVTLQNAPEVAAICWRLAGLPLALELAAARARFLDPAAMLPRLDHALSAGWSRDLPERQRTIRATLDWSYDLLSEKEKSLFRRLSVFAGGFTLEAAEAVGPEATFVLLGGLVEQSLVVVGAGGRYGLLEPVRQYALERLEESGETGEARRRHAMLFLELSGEAESGLSGPGHVAWVYRLEAEQDNVRAALSWMLENEKAEAALRTAGALRIFWQTRGLLAEGREWIEKSLSLEGSRDGDPAVIAARANALIGVGWLAVFEDQFVLARERLEESVTLYRELGDEQGLALALTYLGYVATLGQQPDIPLREVLDEAMSLRPLLRDKLAVMSLLILVGLAEAAKGDFAEAIPPTEEALALGREVGDGWGTKVCLVNLGIFTLAAGELARSANFLRENLRLGRATDDKLPIQYGLFGLAHLAYLEGRLYRAARLWGASEAVREAAGIELPPLASAITSHDRAVAAARELMGKVAFDAAWADGKAAPHGESLSYALKS